MYESHFGLSGKPFKLSPDPHFFYGSALHSKAIAYLRYGLELGEGFIVITGPVGTGKTTIARSLLSSLEKSITAIQIVTTRLTPDALITMIASNFGLQVEGLGKAETLKRLEAFLNNLNRQGRRALLVIDEAQNLPSESIEELRMLSNFQVNDKPLIQSFLLGQEELKPIIELPQMEQFRQRIIASCHLKSFNEDETREYILHRLNVVGWQANPQLEPDIFPLVAEYTGGVPRKINIFMDRLFLFAFMENLTTINVNSVQSVIDEMESELSGGLQKQTVQPAASVAAANGPLAPAVDAIQLDKIYTALTDVSKILDDVVSRKTLTIKHLDRLIREKRKELSEPEPEPEFEPVDVPVDHHRLVDKHWLRQLIKEQESEV